MRIDDQPPHIQASERDRLLALATYIIDSGAFNNPDDTIDAAVYGEKVAIAALTIYRTIAVENNTKNGY